MTSGLKFQYMVNMTETERKALIEKEKTDQEEKEIHQKQCKEYIPKLSSEQLKYQLNQLAQNDTGLDSLNWAGQQIEDNMILKLALCLKNNTHCTTIDLENCRMTAASAGALAQVLSSKRVGRLTVSGNPLGDQGLQLFLDEAMRPDVIWNRIEAKNIGATKTSLLRTSHLIRANHHVWEVQFRENNFSPEDWELYNQINDKFRIRRRTEIRLFQRRGGRLS